MLIKVAETSPKFLRNIKYKEILDHYLKEELGFLTISALGDVYWFSIIIEEEFCSPNKIINLTQCY